MCWLWSVQFPLLCNHDMDDSICYTNKKEKGKKKIIFLLKCTVNKWRFLWFFIYQFRTFLKKILVGHAAWPAHPPPPPFSCSLACSITQAAYSALHSHVAWPALHSHVDWPALLLMWPGPPHQSHVAWPALLLMWPSPPSHAHAAYILMRPSPPLHSHAARPALSCSLLMWPGPH